MAAYAAVVSLMNNIHQIRNHPHLSTSFDNNQIQPLLVKAKCLLHFIEANNHGGGSKEAQDLEREIASAAHAAEDVIESHLVAQIHAGTSEPSLSCSLDLQQKTQDMDAAVKKATEFKGSRGSGEEQPAPVMEIGETAMVGREAELNQLLHELNFGHPSNLDIISIVGMGGTGKTTLAKNIFENKLIKEHFHFCAWATISQQHNANATLSQILHGLGESNNNDLGLQLHKNLSGRRYLIILDDIWSVKSWDEVRRFFPDNNNGSRIILTTRLSDVAKDCGSSPFIMRFLDEYNSRKLFYEVAFKNEPCPPELEEVSEEIVKVCKGLEEIQSHLHLCYMFDLEEIPEGIGDIPTLKLIRMEYSNMSAAISAVKIKEAQLDNGNDSLQIEVLLWESEMEDFKERVESEGLSISTINWMGWM